MKKLIAMAIVALTAIEFVSAAPTVTDITAKQRYPWSGLVDISCKVSGIEADSGGYEVAVVALTKTVAKNTLSQHFRFSIMAKKCLMSAATEIIRSCGMRVKTWGRSSSSA